MGETIAVLEAGSTLPVWVDEQNGADSSVWVLAQRCDEPYAAFARRVTGTIATFGGEGLRQAVFVQSHDALWDATDRRMIVAALCERMKQPAGRVVLLPPPVGELTGRRGAVPAPRAA